VPCLYKCSARTSVLARRRGHEVLRIAHEAWLRPDEYDISTRSRRQLRRKLRHATQAGLRFEATDPHNLPRERMARINAAWAEAHGGERGFSMGRYHPDLIAYQRVFLAWHGTDLLGFATFHCVDAEWTLDLLRPMPGAMDGTAHGMIDCALREAAAQGVPRLSLAAAPLDHSDAADPGEAPLAKLQRRIAHRSGGTGLARFKSMFDPEWQPLYIAAPSRWALLRAGAEIARAVATPHTGADHATS
jgi:phosphatidylglycerol lysyltransferase